MVTSVIKYIAFFLKQIYHTTKLLNFQEKRQTSSFSVTFVPVIGQAASADIGFVAVVHHFKRFVHGSARLFIISSVLFTIPRGSSRLCGVVHHFKRVKRVLHDSTTLFIILADLFMLTLC
ncbi:hypothetical protein F9802_09350 [Bacillus aerolatus]|uniref:Uncharacterized protein n=1 Tax=Bacillus aerolatus TaxID=2653354 RepID=A0A6I1FKL2_9BACI|nr:hypothetical protein [Bacillus aerolatus]KAB7707202.1 hypothetical protein F9802_09350 [Bacillus aerolatus]